MNWLDPHSSSVEVNVASPIIEMWKLRLRGLKPQVQGSDLAERELELRRLTQE